MNKLSDRLLKNYLLGKCSSAQLREIEEWISQSEDNANWLFNIEQLYRSGLENPYENPTKIQQAELRLLAAIRKEREKESNTRRMTFLRYAASLLVLIAVGATALYYYNKVEMVEIAATTDMKKITLPDGSTVWLNSNSLLRYPAEFKSKERKVELDGEALFAVVHNEEQPFRVKSKGLETTVLGTEFNFNTRSDADCEEVTLLKGCVQVEGLSGEGKIIIQPNQKVVLNKQSHSMRVVRVYAPLSTVWHDNLIPFHNMRISEIVGILEEYYGVRIHYSGLDDNATYSGDIRRMDSIDSVLSDLSYSIPFRYKIDEKNVKLIGK